MVGWGAKRRDDNEKRWVTTTRSFNGWTQGKTSQTAAPSVADGDDECGTAALNGFLCTRVVPLMMTVPVFAKSRKKEKMKEIAIEPSRHLLLPMNFSIFILFIATVFLTGQAAIFSSYPLYQNSNWHYDNYGNLMIGNRDNGFYMGPCFGPECPWGK
ncbi:unnamed protein product [Caenorhabditis nigoni]